MAMVTPSMITFHLATRRMAVGNDPNIARFDSSPPIDIINIGRESEGAR